MMELREILEILFYIMVDVLLLGGLGGIVSSLILWSYYREKREPNYKPVRIFRIGLFMSFYGFIVKLILLYVNEIYYYSTQYSFKDDIKSNISIIAVFVIFIILFNNKKIAFILSNSKYDLTK